jgi:hypothetical protein
MTMMIRMFVKPVPTKNQRGHMNRWIRGAVICLVAIAIGVGITACMNWFTGAPEPTLLLGPVVIIGNQGEILLSVNNMPDGGLASLAIVLGGITYDAAKISNVSVEPLVGFVVLAEQFAAGIGGFLIAHSVAGLHDGAFAKITFKAANNPTLADFVFTKADMSMGDDSNNAIAFVLQDAFAYYSK